MAEKKALSLTQAVSDGIFLFGLRSDNTVWRSPTLPPLEWTRLPGLPSGETMTSLGVTFTERDETSGVILFANTAGSGNQPGKLWFWDRSAWT